MSDRADDLRRMREAHGTDSPEAQAAFDARMAEVLAEEDADPEPGLYMLSFCDPTRPPGTQYLGGAVVAARGPTIALTIATLFGANPGGEVQMAGPLPFGCIADGYLNRLLTREEVESIPAPEGWGE